MKHFTALFSALDESNKTNDKLDALQDYFVKANEKDAIWAVALLCGKRPKRLVKTSLLREWAAEKAQIPFWLFEEAYHITGDLAETIAKVLPETEEIKSEISLHWVIHKLISLSHQDESIKRNFVEDMWHKLNNEARFVFNKILTGGFRVGVSDSLVHKALSKVFGMEQSAIASALTGNWLPENSNLTSLLTQNVQDLSKPYPFCLAHPLDADFEQNFLPNDWFAEYKWDGIRAQLIKRQDSYYLWSRGEEIINEVFPELKAITESIIGDAVFDGEIVVRKEGEILSFNVLQNRLGRKSVSKKILADVPAFFIAYDILEYNQKDLRRIPLQDRRKLLEEIVQPNFFISCSELLPFENFQDLKVLRKRASEYKAEGLMLKNKTESYPVGRKKGVWWKWKIDPMAVDAVLIYAQRGHGRRANLYSDYTFAVWNDKHELVPFAKAYSGLSDEEMRQTDAWIKKNTLERFGPVCSVKPELVFEIAFEGINESKRHKSGIAVRFPRISRWRMDKKPEQANTLQDLKLLLT
jgi:DNA ligase-1